MRARWRRGVEERTEKEIFLSIYLLDTQTTVNRRVERSDECAKRSWAWPSAQRNVSPKATLWWNFSAGPQIVGRHEEGAELRTI
jgi:hypothetical protein